MNTMNKLMVLTAFVWSSAVFANGVLPSKINLLLVDVGTIDTVAKTEKFMAAMDKVVVAPPPAPTAAEAVIDPDFHKVAVRLNFITGVAEYYRTKEAVAAENDQHNHNH